MCSFLLRFIFPISLSRNQLCVEHGGNVGEATWYARYCNLHGFVSAEVNTSAAGSVRCYYVLKCYHKHPAG